MPVSLGPQFATPSLPEPRRKTAPFRGQLFPPASKPSPSAAIRAAHTSLKNQLDAAVKPGAALSLNITVNGNWFSAGVFSTADVKGSNDGTLFGFHYRPPGQEHAMLGAKVDRDSVYRIGSTSNLLTIYALLAERGDVDWKLPITDE